MGDAVSPEMTRPTIPHEPFDEWSVLATVGALDEDERIRFDAHLATGCDRCEEQLRQYREVATTLARTLPDEPVPSDLRGRLMARVTKENQASSTALPRDPSRAIWRRPWAGALVAAGLVGIVAWGIYDTRSTVQRQQASIDRLQQELAEQKALTSLVSDTDTDVAALRGIGVAERADGWVVWSPAHRRGYLVVHNLPPLPPGRQYQFWVKVGPQPMPAGVFGVDAVGHAALVVTVDTERPDVFAVTVEQAGGAPAPSGPVVLQGSRQDG
jgi:anti-sigma-K factor RskA